ncbi:hypothetical protein M434DRAFT_28502 [Hypoxylon sp. CO27-5]|nr:hypothetical protein M434DRAFT_28502 [Hypoxylon sp. CO27-5]
MPCLFKSIREGPRKTLIEVLVDTKDSLATGPRDKISGIINPVSGETTTQIKNNGFLPSAKLIELDPWFSNPVILPDYGKSFQKVLTDTTLAMILAEDNRTCRLAGGLAGITDTLASLLKTGYTGLVKNNAFVPLDREHIIGECIWIDEIVYLSPSRIGTGSEWLKGCWELLCRHIPERYPRGNDISRPGISPSFLAYDEKLKGGFRSLSN